MVKILVVVATSDKEKAKAALMYATNAKRFGWVEDIKVVYFGPIEKMIAEEDEEIMSYIRLVRELGLESIACKRIAEIGGYLEKLKVKVKTEYVGKYVSDLLENGYVPLVF